MQSCVRAGQRLQQGLLSVTSLWHAQVVPPGCHDRPGLQGATVQCSMHHAAKQCARWQVHSILSSKPLRS